MTDAPDPLVIFTPSGRRGRFPAGTPVLTAARQLGVDLDSVCGGRGICSRCQITPSFGEFSKHGVVSRPEALSEWNKVEQRYKDKRGLIDGRRLGCQATIQGDVVIDVPPESQVHRQIVRKRAEARDIVLDPAVRLHFVEVVEPDMHQPSGDLERLRDALAQQWGVEGATASLGLLKRLQKTLREGEWKATVAVHTPAEGAAPRILEVWPGLREKPVWGAAIDLGSTTIACHLADLHTGEVRASGGVMNPQIRFGEDLMSRVSYSMMNPGGAEEMTLEVRRALAALLAETAQEAGAEPADILETVIVCNPVMHHLVLGVDPVELGWAPFALATSDAVSCSAAELSLNVHPDAQVYLLPCIAGHVGADAAAVALSESPQTSDDLVLIVDVGTNAEIQLGDKRRVLACSSPTGPAFEGAQISSGQRAAPGAVERVRIDPETKEPRFRVIGQEAWSDEAEFDASRITGICGSGIIEVIAEMRLAGIIDEDGVIGSAEQTGSARCVADGRTHAYVLHDGREDGGPLVSVTQNDVRAIQLAKAALTAGAQLLMDRMEVETVDRVVLAGAFGAHISPLHALVLGMIPDCAVDKVTSAGNAAGTGARIALLNRGARREIEQVVRRIEKIETAIEPRFQEHFVGAMAIPHKSAPYPELGKVATLPAVSYGGSGGGGGDAGGRRRRRRG
ncbi:ASKHA domain-containing protein [Albimonas sp. CAU 1670]|uniref:ASKHA domain-containing protein n=1 Tax=Albimonas sp. CAU 1670 TaxID=3032599 RepID=UPI0023DA64C0|nr:ASKHA domain-containing protein [Albimonas sp. CAU 1670]MDF2231897.1 ASKHA domain-containing protein [Albimonas sp. CAU 1670]